MTSPQDPFEVLRIQRGIRGGGYVEFQRGTGDTPCTHWKNDSLCLDEDAFGLISRAFDCHPKFNYYGDTLFAEDELRALAAALAALRSDLVSAPTDGALATRLGPMYGNIQHLKTGPDSWRQILDALLESVDALIHLAKSCLHEKKSL